MNLAYKYPIVFWNTACLITNSGGNESYEDNNDNDEDIYTNDIIYDNSLNFDEEEEEEEDIDEEDKKNLTQKKKKAKKIDYGKISIAIGKMQAEGIKINSPNINHTSYTFYPNEKDNKILCGFNSITRFNQEVIKEIIANRPYTSFEDFCSKVKLNKLQMTNLIKSGAFDEFGSREAIMKKYISSIYGEKKRLTLQNMKMLIDYKLIPDSLGFEIKIYNFTKYLRKFKDGNFYLLDNIAFKFYNDNFSLDELVIGDCESGFKILQRKWDKIYDSYMNNIRKYIKDNYDNLLTELNELLFNEMWNKYCNGTISKWEMDSISFYTNEHELAHLQNSLYNISNFNELASTPVIDDIFMIKGKKVPIYKIFRIAGTVLDRDKIKKSVTLLTTTGVVIVKIYGNAFNMYDKQISEIGADGKKHIIESSMFKRGNKIIVTGIKTDDSTFIMKTYKRTPYHSIELIKKINEDGTIETTNRSLES